MFKAIERVQYFLLKIVFFFKTNTGDYYFLEKSVFLSLSLSSCSHNLYLQCLHCILYLYIVKRIIVKKLFKKGGEKVDGCYVFLQCCWFVDSLIPFVSFDTWNKRLSNIALSFHTTYSIGMDSYMFCKM